MIVLAIDADGTIFDDRYPKIGEAKTGAIHALNTLHDAGFCIIINTCRVGKYEDDLREWLKEKNVKYCRINENCPILIEKYGTDTRKISADLYIDLEKDLLGLTSDIVNYPIWSYIRRLILKKYGCFHTPGCKTGGVS
jgi:hypothetical protein